MDFPNLTQIKNCVKLGNMSKLVVPRALEKKAFSTNEAYELGLSKYDLRRLLDSGQITKISRGYYQHEEEFSLDEESLFENAILRAGKPACICLVSALAHYGITDLIGKRIWVMVPADRRRSYPDIRLLRVRSPHWDVGIDKQSKYWITTVERTLVDCLVYRRLVGTNTGVEAIRRYLKERQSSLEKVYEMGKKLSVDHRILPYIEALA
jgi:predicted transcriptional regulator of viral defense system